MKKLSTKAPFILGGTMAGHPFAKSKPGGAFVSMPVKTNVANIYGRKAKASRPAIQAINQKGA